MKIRRVAAPLVLAASLGLAVHTAGPVSAQTVHQGKPYGCQINPSACVTVMPITPQPAVLPTTGGGAPAGNSFDGSGAGIAGLLMLLGGAALVRRTTRR